MNTAHNSQIPVQEVPKAQGSTAAASRAARKKAAPRGKKGHDQKAKKEQQGGAAPEWLVELTQKYDVALK